MTVTDLADLQFEDASEQETAAIKSRESKIAETPFPALLTATLETGKFKKVTAKNEEQADAISNAVKTAARFLDIGYRIKRDGNVVLFKGAPKKSYSLSEEGKQKRVEAIKAAAAKRREEKEKAENSAPANGAKATKAKAEKSE